MGSGVPAGLQPSAFRPGRAGVGQLGSPPTRPPGVAWVPTHLHAPIPEAASRQFPHHPPDRVAEKETVNKMSLHNLATVFGPTLLRPSEKENKPPANPSQAISMTDSWSLEVMSQVWWARLPGPHLWPLPASRTPASCQGFPLSRQGRWLRSGDGAARRAAAPPSALGWGSQDRSGGRGAPGLCCEVLVVPSRALGSAGVGGGGTSPSLSRHPLPLRPAGPGAALLPAAGGHPCPGQQEAERPLLHRSLEAPARPERAEDGPGPCQGHGPSSHRAGAEPPGGITGPPSPGPRCCQETATSGRSGRAVPAPSPRGPWAGLKLCPRRHQRAPRASASPVVGLGGARRREWFLRNVT